MRKSFYTWLMTERNPKSNSPKAILADLAFEEAAFPKHTDDFDEVSRFLEEHASFSFNLGDFDSIWQEYARTLAFIHWVWASNFSIPLL
ncbi:serine-type D-Ala-D-Ala carboxypeptidase [Streptococcus pneumoniae]|nr:serine-type D-Ala-D-Ala carboxypeptidase [Streptococcus pneumoniae]VIU47336.1 serine-type D-Ala-D-Ala carboxypeptidase [Streptococcus pneumoniae]VMV56819.1 serine-type D-Ala-D-Ala carboxypeptidase [Streptococcus pneumoniae]VOM04831.1 serine-type D-Ala-D-Ala carboxypeptidase [Streptococcus pneumoniae]